VTKGFFNQDIAALHSMKHLIPPIVGPNRAAARGAHSPREAGEAILKIVNQVNRGAALITSQEERDQVAELYSE
jgi:hypothetical protein